MNAICCALWRAVVAMGMADATISGKATADRETLWLRRRSKARGAVKKPMAEPTPAFGGINIRGAPSFFARP